MLKKETFIMEFFEEYENWKKRFILISIVVFIIISLIFLADGLLPPIRQTDYDMAMIVDAGIIKKNIIWYSIDGDWVYICSHDAALGETIYRVHESNVVLIKTEAAWD
jgi:hypothetical protein